jgi:hypothetical protein
MYDCLRSAVVFALFLMEWAESFACLLQYPFHWSLLPLIVIPTKIQMHFIVDVVTQWPDEVFDYLLLFFYFLGTGFDPRLFSLHSGGWEKDTGCPQVLYLHFRGFFVLLIGIIYVYQAPDQSFSLFLSVMRSSHAELMWVVLDVLYCFCH